MAGLTSLTTPATLEALLSLRPMESAGSAAAGSATAAPLPKDDPATTSFAPQASLSHTLAPPSSPMSAAGLPLFNNEQTQLLFIHGSSQESVLAQTWLQRMLGSAQLHTARFQDGPAEQALQLMPYVALIDFGPTSIDLATQLVAQMRALSPHLPLIAVGRTKHPQCMLAALRAGVQDFLDVDGSLLAAHQTLQDLLRRSPPVPSTGPSAPLTAILSARAGLGCSLLASHLAWYLQQHLRGTAPSKTADSSSDLDSLLIDLGPVRPATTSPSSTRNLASSCSSRPPFCRTSALP